MCCGGVFSLRKLRVSAVIGVIGCLLGLAFPLESWTQASGRNTSVWVRVTDVNSEQPLQQARVEILRFPSGLVHFAVTDSMGQVEFARVLTNQNYILRASKDGYVAGEQEFDTRREEFSKRLYIALSPIEKKTPTAPGDTVSAQSLGAPPEAVKEFREGLKLLNEHKDAEASLRHFRKAISIYPRYAEAHALMGIAYLQMNSAPQAEIALRRAIEVDPKLQLAYYPLGVLLANQKRYDEAETLLKKGMEMDPQGWKWPFELARCSAGRNDWPKAVEYAEAARALPNPSSKVYLLLADIYSGMGEREKAIAALEEFIRVDPQSPYMPRAQQALADLKAKN